MNSFRSIIIRADSKNFQLDTVEPISILLGERGGTYGLVVRKTERCSVDGAVWTVLSEVDNISSLTEEKGTPIKAFLYS